MRRKKMNIIIATTHPPPLVKMKGKRMIVQPPDWRDRMDARKMRKNPTKTKSIPTFISPKGLPRGLLSRRCLLAHWRQRPSSGR